MRKRLLIAALIGALLGLPLVAFGYLGRLTAALPSPAAALFEFVTRLLPGTIVTAGIEVMVGVLQQYDIGDTAEVAKTLQTGMGWLMLLGLLAVLGVLYGLVVGRRDRYALAGGFTAGAVLWLMLAPLGLRLGWDLESFIWALVLSVGWGGSLGWAWEHWLGGQRAAQRSDRRRFLAQLGAGAGALAAGSLGLAWLLQRDDETTTAAVGTPTPAPSGFRPVPGTRPEITPLPDFYRVDINLMPPRLDAADWRLAVEGLVDNPLDLSLDDLRALPHDDFYATMECISNNVGGDLISTTLFTGVPLRHVLDRAGVQPGTVDIKFTCADGYTESLPLESALDEETRLCFAMGGEPLTAEHGYPTRLFTPNRFGMKNPKWITRIEAVDEDYFGYWEQRRWSEAAWVKTTSVIDTAQSDEPQQLRVGGIAYAGSRGIQRVEVQVDDGPWMEAEMKPPLSGLTWELWRAELDAPPGGHELTVRAVDGEGNLQTARRSRPHPDGATGYHSINVTVA